MRAGPPDIPSAPLDYRLIAAASLFLSLWLFAADPLVNRDAIIYLRSAEAYLQGGFAASQKLFARPLVPISIALLHQLTGIPLVYAGQLLVSLFYALFCAGFVASVSTLGGNRRVQLIAAIIILSHPVLNDHRASIVRDPFYWAFIILAFREALLYLRKPLLTHQLRWFFYMLLASVCRFEGLFFAALAPLSLLLVPDLDHRLRHCLRLLAAPLVVGGGYLMAVLVWHPGALPLPGIEGYIRGLLALPHQFAQVALASGEIMLRGSSREDASTAVLAGLCAILLLNVCRALTWPYVLVLFWGLKSKLQQRMRPGDATVLQAHLLISLAYLAAFTLINRFMLERYSNQFVIFALLFVPFVLDELWQSSGRRWKQIAVAGILIGMSLDSLYNGNHEKAFIRDGKDWLVANTPAEATLVSNDLYIAYFSGRDFNWDAAKKRKYGMDAILSSEDHWSGRDYMAMRVRLRDKARWESFIKEHSLHESAVIDGGRHGQLTIVEIPNTTKEQQEH